ncbi:hypothetical protein OAL44_02710 [Planctomycetaceae bacterium]|nr:hypothetical protein [bacterium]MDB4786964.1 hypothetical protein [Planctomycetaceae bacterium]MDC0274129.1 hypothetical protein [Planctomycetaceae bacterium]MDC0308025.1 hypothetical protein [Planctomycetaceae bacterium]
MSTNNLIHLGMPKTATTYLQWKIFKEHSQINYLGKQSSPEQFISPAVELAADCLRHPEKKVLVDHYDFCKHEIANIQDPERLTVFSCESFTFGSRSLKKQKAEMFHQFFGDCQILITIREPLDFMKTFYFQNLNTYNAGHKSQSKYITHFGLPPRYFSFDDWLETVWSFPHQGAFTHLDVANTAEAFGEVFGFENIIIRPFEAFKLDNKKFLIELSNTLGIDVNETLGLAQKADSVLNPRMTQNQFEMLKRVGLWSLDHWRHRYNDRSKILMHRLRKEALNKNDKTAASVEYTPLWRQRVVERSSKQLLKLSQRWDLSLEDYGYVLKTPADDHGQIDDRNAA